MSMAIIALIVYAGIALVFDFLRYFFIALPWPYNFHTCKTALHHPIWHFIRIPGRMLCNLYAPNLPLAKIQKDMKQILFSISLMLISAMTSYAQEYTVITTVESIVPAGLGRSRMIANKEDLNTAEFTRERTDGKTSDMNEVKRSELKIDNFEETKMLNFYSVSGINFQNIASNDALISAKLNEMAKAGWTLLFVSTGVEGDAGTQDGEGIFITRYIFKR
jgi:hypothetical protein